MTPKFLCVGAVFAVLATAGAAQAAPATVHVVLKFVKSDAARAGGPVASLDPASCPACVVRHDPAFERDNPRETLVELDIPKARYLELAFTVRPGAVRRVTLETRNLNFHQDNDHLIVQTPPLRSDAVDAGEFATHLVEPGLVLRMEHLDPDRLAGDYAGAPAPRVERRAADNLEFAQREAVRELGLGEWVARERIGVIEIMGFDTNFPHGHKDSPPHMHMHLRWPYNTGTQIGHFYIGADGRLLEVRVGLTRAGLPSRTFHSGETFTTDDDHGRAVYAQTVTPDGGLTLASVHPGAASRTCLIRPEGEGFQGGAIVACADHDPVKVRVEDDSRAGVTRIWTGPIVETLRYDPDTGLLTSPTGAPPIPDSAVVPTSQAVLALPDAAEGAAVTPDSD